MQITIYLDVIFFINFVADFFVLLIAGVILKRNIVPGRLFAGALFGAGVLLFFILSPPALMGGTGIAVYIGISMGAVAISYGGKIREFFRTWFLSTTIMILIGSIMNYLKYIFHTNSLQICKWILYFSGSGLCIFVIIYSLRSTIQTEDHMYLIKLQHGSKRMAVPVYLDTGNMLRDPLFGKPVIVLSEQVIKNCLTREEEEILNQYRKNGRLDYSTMLTGKIQRRDCFHEIAFESVGNPSGKMLCMLMEEVDICECKRILKKQPVAIGPGALFEGKLYQGLLHKECI